MERKFPFIVLLLGVIFSQAVVADSKISKSGDRLIAEGPPSVEKVVRYKKVIICVSSKVSSYPWVEEGNNVRAYGPLFMGSTYVRQPKVWPIGVTRWGCNDYWVEADDESTIETEGDNND